MDAGAADSGETDLDSGSPSTDAGLDSGPADAGPPCPSDCGDEYCNESLGQCAECLVNEHCPRELPFCDDQLGAIPGFCTACGDDSTCTERENYPVCDEVSGECVPCTPDTEETTCTNGLACLPGLFQCNGAERGSIPLCGACSADSECESQSVLGADVEVGCLNNIVLDQGVCLVETTSHQALTGESCPSGFMSPENHTSASGWDSVFCIPSMTTSCLAIRDLIDNRNCNTPDESQHECGLANTPDGYCRPDQLVCTTQCADDDDCLPNFGTCQTGGWCG